MQVMADALGLNPAARDALWHAGRLEQAVALDSIATVQVILAIENAFGVVIEPERLDVRFIGDVAGVAEYLTERRGASS
jgi:acyl carrier protein